MCLSSLEYDPSFIYRVDSHILRNIIIWPIVDNFSICWANVFREFHGDHNKLSQTSHIHHSLKLNQNSSCHLNFLCHKRFIKRITAQKNQKFKHKVSLAAKQEHKWCSTITIHCAFVKKTSSHLDCLHTLQVAHYSDMSQPLWGQEDD
jgi:hypothetical protein